MQNKFFGSKLNSVLLLTLIILMVIAIHIMLQNKEVYFWAFVKPAVVENKVDTSMPAIPKDNLLGNKNDLVSFSIWPNTKVHGVVSFRGVIKGGYFFEANIGINILNANKKVLKASNAVAKTEWTTTGPVDFEGNIDFTVLPKGPGFIEIHNDNPSGLPKNDKSILVPIIIN